MILPISAADSLAIASPQAVFGVLDAQLRADAGGQFAPVERLGDVIVGAQAQASRTSRTVVRAAGSRSRGYG